ncbi:glycoside hydrolase family 18 protein [Hebeloma cylindrosporum]|uniref:Glycoside hydrolase family 18 protein n=1 Tax=Hebeloma cylindrosporum TaxID=76867 RepID=A0A0C2XJ75_HEBCY|nr:glycoside hydrolase family 18 protein [Hebeloma cylindrosporum h7]
MSALVTSASHTTSSVPRPHIVYTTHVNVDGKEITVHRRYSEFAALQEALKDPYNLPPKRLLVTTFIPSAWADDTLIAERKAGLAEYLFDVLSTPKYKDRAVVQEFLSGRTAETEQKFDLEDSLPSTVTRNKALALASDPLDGKISAQAAMIYGAYYTSWTFVTPSSDNTINWGGSSNQDLLRRLVAGARSSGYGTRVVLSIGGWGGCYYFSQACSTAANRTKFANAIATAVNTYNLDGVDFDWEFPNYAGPGQPYSAADSANLLSLFKLMRISLGPCKIISAAVSHVPWLGSNGQPLKDVSAYAAELDYVNIMQVLTPLMLGNLCGTSKQPQASAQGALAAWTAAKFPASQLLLGLALYGYVSKSSKTVLTGSSMPSQEMVLLHKIEEKDDNGKASIVAFLNGAHANDTIDGEPPKPEPVHEAARTAGGPLDEPVKALATLTGYWGKQIAFKDIVASGALVKKSDGNYGQAGGFTMGWDNCSNTPYLFNTAQTTVVTYDDTWSLTDKAKFAKSSGMAGCFTWSLDQDDGMTLQNAIRKGLGK